MTTSLERRAQELFQAAIELPVGERDDYLDRECGDRPGLRAEVDSLFAAHDAAGNFLETSALESGAALVESLGPAHVVGDSRKFPSKSQPCGVKKDSGWNCRPKSGRSRCRTADAAEPMAVRAETSKQSGISAATSEW